MATGNVEDLWEVRVADELPAAFSAAATDQFEFFHAPVWLPNAVALSGLALGAGIEFGAAPALTDDAVADYLTATTHTLKNVNGTVSNSPLSGATNPTGGQAFWLYIKDTSAFTAAQRRAKRLAAREAALASVVLVGGVVGGGYYGAASTRAAVRAEVGESPVIGSLYQSSAGKLYLKFANAAADTDWQRVTTTAAD